MNLAAANRRPPVEVLGGLIAGIAVITVARYYLMSSQAGEPEKEDTSAMALQFKDEIKQRPYSAPKSFFGKLYLQWEKRDDLLNDGLAVYSPPGWGLRIMKEIVIYYSPGLVFLFCAANDPDVFELDDDVNQFFDIREEINEIVEEIQHRYHNKTSVVLIPPPPLTQVVIETNRARETEFAITEYYRRAEQYSQLCEEQADQLNIPVLNNFWSTLDQCSHSSDREWDFHIGDFLLNTKMRIDLFKSINAKYLQPELPQ